MRQTVVTLDVQVVAFTRVQEQSMTTSQPRASEVVRGPTPQADDPRDGDPHEGDVVALVRAASTGDQIAWDALVDRYHRLVWAVARSYRLDAADAADVTQTTWLRLVEHLGSLRDAERVGAWLVTTARREALRMARQRETHLQRHTDVDLTVLPDASASVEDAFVRDEDDATLWRALRQLDERCQRLLRCLAVSPTPRYDQIAQALGMPVGSIGPTRGRCLERLRKMLVDVGWRDDAAAIEGAR